MCPPQTQVPCPTSRAPGRERNWDDQHLFRRDLRIEFQPVKNVLPSEFGMLIRFRSSPPQTLIRTPTVMSMYEPAIRKGGGEGIRGRMHRKGYVHPSLFFSHAPRRSLRSSFRLNSLRFFSARVPNVRNPASSGTPLPA
jgi:hypothetical protein